MSPHELTVYSSDELEDMSSNIDEWPASDSTWDTEAEGSIDTLVNDWTNTDNRSRRPQVPLLKRRKLLVPTRIAKK